MKIFITFLLFFCLSIPGFSQSVQSVLHGVVTDSRGEPLPGASILVKGTRTGTSTGTDGTYVLRAGLKDRDVLLFSFLGMEEKEVVYHGQTELNVAMRPGRNSLEEVVVFARQNINELDIRARSGVVQQVDMERLKDKPMVSMALALQGAIPGLVVTNTGDLGQLGYLSISTNAAYGHTDTPNGTSETPADLVYKLNPYETRKGHLYSYPNGEYTFDDLLNQYRKVATDKRAGVSADATIGTFSYSTDYYADERLLHLLALYNLDLRPEQTTTCDASLSVEFFKRLSLDFNLYRRETKDALLDVPIPLSNGFDGMKRNIGVLRNEGFELSMMVRSPDGKDWRGSLRGSIAYNRNKVVDLYYTDRLYTSESALVPDFEVGKPYDILFGLHSLGINPITGLPVFRGAEGEEIPAFENRDADLYFRESRAIFAAWRSSIQTTATEKSAA